MAKRSHSIHCVMDRETLRKICKDTRGCYQSPDLNDKLYLNDYNFCRIEGLEEFVNLKALWLQSNAFSIIEGLSHLSSSLRVLHLHSNRIDSLAGLEELINLDTLNLSTNILQNLAGVSKLKNLSNLYVSRNLIREAAQVVELGECKKLSVLDLSENKIDDTGLVDVLATLNESLCVLYLNGNPVLSKFLPYRKRMISVLSSLTCLDGLPIEILERRCCEVWAVGGREAELAERELVRQEVRERNQRDRAALRRTLAEGRARRAIREGTGQDDEKRIQKMFGHSLQSVTLGRFKEGDECTVCQQEFIQGTDAYQLPCLHKYHPNCILRWLGHSSSCPMCRMDLTAKSGADKVTEVACPDSTRSRDQDAAIRSERPAESTTEQPDIHAHAGEGHGCEPYAPETPVAETALVRAVRESLFDFDAAAARLSSPRARLSANTCRLKYSQAVENWRIAPSQ